MRQVLLKRVLSATLALLMLLSSPLYASAAIQQSMITSNNINAVGAKSETTSEAKYEQALMALPTPKSYASAEKGMANLNLDFLEKDIEVPSGVVVGAIGDIIDDLVKLNNAIDPTYFLMQAFSTQTKNERTLLSRCFFKYVYFLEVYKATEFICKYNSFKCKILLDFSTLFML